MRDRIRTVHLRFSPDLVIKSGQKSDKPEKLFIQFRVNKWINRLSDPGDFLLPRTTSWRI